MPTIEFVGTYDDVVAKINELAAIFSGEAVDFQDIGKGFVSAIGFAALSDIHEAYVTKARGGTDAMGIQWPPLKPATIANRKVGRKDKQQNEAIRTREKIRKREFKKLFGRFLLSLPENEARTRALQVAGARATREMGKNKIETLGGRSVEILRDTGILLNSLSPGELQGANYSPPSLEGSGYQIFTAGNGEVIVGTNVKYARTHQDGAPDRNIPRRQFLPDENSEIPHSWLDNWGDAARRATEAAITIYLAA